MDDHLLELKGRLDAIEKRLDSIETLLRLCLVQNLTGELAEAVSEDNDAVYNPKLAANAKPVDCVIPKRDGSRKFIKLKAGDGEVIKKNSIICYLYLTKEDRSPEKVCAPASGELHYSTDVISSSREIGENQYRVKNGDKIAIIQPSGQTESRRSKRRPMKRVKT